MEHTETAEHYKHLFEASQAALGEVLAELTKAKQQAAERSEAVQQDWLSPVEADGLRRQLDQLRKIAWIGWIVCHPDDDAIYSICLDNGLEEEYMSERPWEELLSEMTNDFLKP